MLVETYTKSNNGHAGGNVYEIYKRSGWWKHTLKVTTFMLVETYTNSNNGHAGGNIHKQ